MVSIVILIYLNSSILGGLGSRISDKNDSQAYSDFSFEIIPTHPRIFFTESDLPLLRQKANTTHTDQWNRFSSYLDEWLDYNYSNAPSEWYFHVDVPAFAFGYMISSDPEYLNKTIELMELMIEWDIPNDDMPNRERLLALSFAFDWIYNSLSTDQRISFGELIEDYMHWVSDYFNSANNWFQGHERWGMITLCIGALSTYYDIDNASAYLNESIDPILNHIIPIWEYFGGEDGGHYYGTDYEGIVLRDMMYFFESWLSSTGEDLIEDSAFWPKCIDYRMAITHYDMTQERIDDCWSANVQSCEKIVAGWISKKYNVESAQWFAEIIDEHDEDGSGVNRWDLWWELLWFDPNLQSTVPQWTTKHFTGIGQVSMRSGWGQNDTIVTFFCGDYGGGHDHYHQNSFTIFQGEELTIHNGAYDSFGSPHHDGYYQRTISSNTITVYDPDEDFAGEVNDGGQRFIRREFGGPRNLSQYQDNFEQYDCGDIVYFYSDPSFDYVMGDATKAYREEKIQDFTRQLVFIKPSIIIVYDRLNIVNPDWEINWHLHSLNPPEINGSTAVISNNDTMITCQTLLPITCNAISSSVFNVYGIFIPPNNWSGGYELGEGRLDISPIHHSMNHQFLHLISIGNSSCHPLLQGKLIESVEQNASGLQVNNQTIWFANNETKNGTYLNKISFIALNNSSHHLMFDVEPSARYKIFQNNELVNYINATTEGFLTINQTIANGDILKIQISKPPTVFFNHEPFNPSINQTVFFNSTSFDSDGYIINWTWNIDNNFTLYGEKVEYSFQENRSYEVNLTVTDNDSNSNFYSKNIVIGPYEIIDINQSTLDRGFPIRHAIDGDWAAAQSFIPTLVTLTNTEIYMRKFGAPEFDLTVELREDHPQGTLIDTLVFTSDEVPSSWEWFPLNFADTSITPGTSYFIVCPPAPSGITTSFGYEWGYAFGNQYNDGAFWFTRDGGGLWRDLPTMYEFVFKTYGYS